MFKEKLQEKKKQKQEEKTIDADLLIDIHHTLMQTYGWIPFEEFKNLPLQTVVNLYQKIMRDKRDEASDPHIQPVVMVDPKKVKKYGKKTNSSR